MTTAESQRSNKSPTSKYLFSSPRSAVERIRSLDVIRGAVMVLMALDHVRVYSGLPAGGPTPGIFFTRWITHFCAPAFVFLAGVGAYLYGLSSKNKRELSIYLATRGFWLVVLELTILRIAWTFNLDFAHYLLAGVIWCIGWCMLLLSALVWLPVPVIGLIGVVIIAGHNLIDPFAAQTIEALKQDPSAWLWQILYFGGPVKLGMHGPTLAVLYSIVPWIGVMAAGFAFGAVMRLTPGRRNRISVALGLACVAAFLVLRGFNIYGNPTPWNSPTSGMPAAISFISTNKYPASLLFLLMTLGPMFLVIPAAELARGRIASALTTIGRVPLFFYILHIPLIHAAAIMVSWVRLGTVSPWLFANHPMMVPPPPPGYTWPLPLLYLVWILVLVPLYFACRWYAAKKQQSPSGWLRYL